jgi:predicted metal-binding membrane protein
MSSAEVRIDARAGRVAVPAALIAVASAGWWWSAEVAGDMSAGGGDEMAMPMSFGAVLVAWVAMMAAMMLPAILPVVKLYALAAARGAVAPVGFFVAGYLLLWTVLSGPAYVAWRALEMPLADGRPWAGRVAGGVLLAAAAWQLTPLKSVCLRHCRSPMGFFMRFGEQVRRPAGALRMGTAHAAFCIGCCWALFAVLVAAASMSLAWLVAFTALIFAERNVRGGERIAIAATPALAALGVTLLVSPSLITTIA